jgi:hypothetical protein
VKRTGFGWAATLALAFAVAFPGAAAARQFEDTFSGIWMLEEVDHPWHSSHADWWLNAGGRIVSDGSVARTTRGDLLPGDKWRTAYASANPTDTDDGRNPQNLLRLITRQAWQNSRLGMYFRIQRTDDSSSPNRNASNGVFLINRYRDGDNLYYAGLRVDGLAVIKKKAGGKYYLLGKAPVFGGSYSKWGDSNLIPERRWIGLKTRAVNRDGGVRLELYLDMRDGTGWRRILEALDNGKLGGGPFTGDGYGGIRGDFMDLEFSMFVAAEITQ